MQICIIQSCYIPWKGFIDLIRQCDEYVIFDSVQYARRHWHNRNRIVTAHGVQWLTIPVVSKGRFDQSIAEVEVSEPWAEQHWRSIALAYKRAPYFSELSPMVENWFKEAGQLPLLTEINELFLRGICAHMGIKTKITRDTEYPANGRQTERLLGITRAAGADHYLSGPSAKDYLDESMFEAAGTKVTWMNYANYPEYKQLHGGFDPAVTILDLMFNTGPDALRYLNRQK